MREVKVINGEKFIRCECGMNIHLYSMWASQCANCGKEYNGFGQPLAPREDWDSDDDY